MFARKSRGLMGAIALALGGATTGLQAADGAWIRGIYAGLSPQPTALSAAAAWRQAADTAAHLERAIVLVGDGESMLPLYPSGTILVLQAVPYPALQRGQTAVYRDAANRAVAHVLVAHARDGWRCTGLNTAGHDMEPVQAANLIGVVVAAFRPVESVADRQDYR